MLMIAGVNLAMAQGLSSNDIKASWDFKNGTVAYSIVSADIPAGSSFAWTVDSKSVTDGISNSGQTITLPLTNKTRSGDVTITSADNTSQTIAFSIEPKAYGVNYDGNHFYADSYQLYPDGTEGDGSKEKPYLISNDLELARLAHEVNNGTELQMFSQKYFKLTKDIDLSKGLWTPIGTAQGIAKASDGHFFAGKFDGDGHSVSNLLIKWSFNTAKEASWGLFARLNGKGNNENEYAAVTNLIIDNARIEKLEAHMPLNNANYTVKMGIVVADMTQNAELSNIIIRNSKITDNNESFSTKTKFRIGGIAGYLNNFVSLRIFNISADTEIDVFRNAALNGVEGQVTISCGFGAASKLANQTGYVVWPRNIYVHGAGLKTSANTTQCKKASVMAFIDADNFASKVKDTWYYTPANKAADTYAYNQYGVEKDISATDATTGEPFGKTFAELNNLYINQNNLDKRPWLYSNSSKRFSFSSIALKAERGTSDVLTVTTEDGETTSDVYNWYASTDNTEGEKVNSTACNPFTLPRQTYSQYVYAMTVDGSQRTNTVLVEAIGITAELDYDTKPGTYIINVKNDTKENFTNDELGLDITYEWHDKETLLSETSNEFVRPETATNKDQYNCTVTVKSGGNIIFHKNIKVTIVVYLCPEAVSINGTTYAQGEDNDDEEWGYSPTQAMKTWKGAYSKLAKTGTWDENIIVLMGTSHTDVTNSQYTGFNITSNNRGKSILKFDDWANAKGESPLFRNATITGDWDGTDYKGTIEIYGAEKGLPIWGDTRFEYITFNNDPVTNNGGDFYKIIYCQYNNLEMGEGIQMTGFGQNSPNYGTIDGAVTTAFHIFGGFNNDGRFFPLDRKERIEAFEQSMPHGKEGFKISIKSGFYSAISAGGRQTSSEKDYNGVMGTPNLPIKCTIEMDIDRKWNDAHNPERGIKGETSKRKSDYDAGIILAGSHEGAMYADVDIIIRSGKVARVVNGSLGAQRDFILPYNGTDYYVPNNTYMGRANILLDPASSKHNNDEWIDNRVIVTEMYGGSTGRGHTGNVIVNNPFYGYSTITINGGLFEILPAGNTKKDNIFCGIYGAGAGGMNGIGEGDDNADSHTPDKSIAYWNESGDVMLYGPYAVAKDRLVTYHCYNNDDFESFTYVDPTNTNTKIVINGGEFGSTTDPIDGIYGGGSGFMSKGLWSSTAATPNKCGGNVYGKVGATVASITINGGEFHCTNGIFAGGRGTDFFYSQNPYGGNSGNYKALGKTYGNVELNINGGIFYCPVFGGGYGVADAKEMGTSNVETLSDMARLYGQSSVNIMGGTFYKNIYGGGDMAIVEFDGNATNVVIGDSADIRGSVFAGGNGRRLRPASQAFAAGDGFTQHPELVGLVAGNANVSFAGSTQQAPFIYGDIFGGGNLAQVANDTHVNIYAGNIAGEVFGGGNGDITDGTVTSADVLGNTNVTLAQDEGGTQNVGHGPIDDSFSINVIWFKMWDPVENIFYIWDPDIDNAGDEPATEDTVYEKSKFYADGKFLNPHNIYGGGNLACNVGTYKDADGNVTTTPADGTGLATVMMQKGMTPYELLITDEWKQSYTDNENPHFSVFGGGFGENAIVMGDTYVNVEMEGRGSILEGIDIVKGEEYKHFFNGYSVMDIIGGGYSGKVVGDTHIVGSGGVFCRRVFGGGTYSSVNSTDVELKAIDCHDIFGGGFMGDVLKSTTVRIGDNKPATSPHTYSNADIFIHGNVYGGNDVSGYVNVGLNKNGYFMDNGGTGTTINIYGGHLFGDVYGAGNGNYLYATDRNGNKNVTVNEYYPINPNDPDSETVPLVYTVPMRENMTQSRATSDAVKMVNINSWRPLTNKVSINIHGVSTSDTVRIDGNVYGGGNSATVHKLLAYGASEDTDKSAGDISVNIGSHVRIGGVFMGCNGEELFVTSEDNDFMNMFQKLNGDINDYTQELDLAEPIDWINDSENANISTVYLPTEKSKRPIVYPYLLDLYFQPVETDIQGSLKWNGSETGEGLTDCVIGTFCCGGNRGNMNVMPKTSGKIGNVLEYTFPEGLTITDKIVGGCNNTNYDYKGKAKHRGGYLLGDADSEYPFIKLNIRNKFMPKEKNDAYVGGNVYGGCFKSGTIVGDVLINLQSDMLAGKDKDKLEKSNELLVKAAEYSALNVYGAGYGMESYIYGIANVTIGESVKCSEPKMDGNKFLPCGVVDPDSNPEGLGVSANFIYGGGQQGNVVGYSTIKILNGHIFRAVTGGSYSGYVYGSTQVIVGYPTYYSTNRQNHVRGRYELKRADRKNLGVENDNGKEKTPAIKQHIYLLNDEWISQGVYEDIVAIDNGNGMRDTITDANRAHYFKKIVSAAPSVGWENVNITIDEAVYGGGYSVAQGSVLANNTTVLKLTDKYNLDYAIIANGNGDDLNLLPGGSTAGFCGNTLVLVGDNKDSEHITISHQDIRPVQLPDGTDLYGYYYKHYASDDDAANGIYTYRYISLQDKYFFKSGATPPSGLEGIRENEFYEYDSEGGIFGDGHLSYAQGFRSADLTGYGFAGHTIDNPKILNTFQRLDIIRLEDNCFSLLGARDYTVNDVNKAPYSIARVGEIKMVANDIRFDSNGNLEAKPDNNTDFRYSTKARNYMGFSNNILYVSAITSNVDFNSGMWRNRNGQLAAASTDNTAFAGMSYQGVKQHYIDDYNANKDKEDAEDPFGEFQKRNDGTAMNMIGIASGYAMKIQLCHETYDSDRKKVVENKLYGPIYGVVEMNLINVREDEGGGYVYADNNHKRHDGDSHEEDFLETTGNFVFPYHKGRYIVDDCFPTGYHAITAPGSDKTVDDVKVHYWYVTGFHYYYNVNISGYTFKSSKENPLEFDSDNKDGLTVLAGLKSTQPISIFNWKMRSGHPDDKSQYSSDLEYRNYLTGTETNETDKTYYSDAVAGGYKLYVGGAESNNFSGATSIDDPDKASKGFAALLSMREKGDDEATLFNNSLPAGLKEDAKISFRLVDMVDNTNYVEPDYFDKHLGRKSMATLVLKAPAYEEYVSETDNKPIYTNTGKFYKKTETGYELVESGNLDADNTYYQPQTEEFVKIESLFTYDTANKKYEKVENISDVIIDESNPTVYYVQREYTYTIYLTIEYVQGPTVSGQITIGNCALPGEMVRVTKDNIVVSADQSFAVNGYYWRIGKRQMGADGKWEFKDTTPWTKENISNNVATGYDTFNQADENGKSLFAGCHYDKTDDLLDVPVYYYMNGYGIQLGVSITGLNDILEVGMHDADKFVVHNYHRMDPHKAGINLHLAEAITRVNEESLDTTESDPLPEPRIYISDKSDLSAFVAFVDSIGTDSNAPRYGAKAQFFLQNDIALEATDKGGYYISDFAGILHGDGHVISGIPSGKSLFNNIESSGNIYNLGLASGKISNLTADGKIGNYHCCFEYAPASGKSGSTPVVYRWDGSPDKGYTTEDFRLGRVAYDLNEYYLRARHRDAATTSSTEADADNEILKYVSAYYANGDYQYACRTDAITGKNTGITYLRIGKGGDTPNYEQVETRHDKTHPLDAPRVKYNADGSIPTPVVYTPLFNANNSGTEPMNDFLFWGQSLQHNPDNYPCDIASHQNSYMSNRVYRTAAYYGDTSLDAFHYNAYNNGSITMSTYVHDSATTAVDFTCLHDLPASTETVGGIFYPPMDDNASRFNDFVVKEDAGITQNLLVYTADNDEATGNEAYDVVEKALNYNETTREALINGHHITKGIDGYSTTLLHLVERTPDNENGDGETCNNNNLCVPIAFNVNDRAWYVRRPLHYAEDSKGAWEGICLPFTVDKVAASLNGEITHFYGSPSDTETDNPSQNIHSLHHEYWLRGLTSIATEGNVPSAVFQRPGAALFSPTDASGNALTNGVSYTFANTFFVDNYADKLYNQYVNPYYATAHNYPDYLRLAGEVPYIVRFPGARYYEFDLSSAFYNDIFGAWEDAQTVTFNAYGDNHTGDTSYGAITIPITKGMATTVGGKYAHHGTFSAINVSNGNVYGMNDSGTAFDDASSLSTVTPFRTYMSPTATRSNARYDYTSVINIAEQNADNIMPDMEENEDDTQKEDHITVRAIGNQRVRIESTMATRLNVVTVAGQLYRILDVQPGIATYSDFQPGLYIFGTTKVIVR